MVERRMSLWTDGKPLTADWLEWVRLNRDRGCDPEELLRRAVAQGFSAAQIQQVLQGEGIQHKSGLIDWTHPPLCNATHRPRAWRLDTPLAQLYEIPSLLSPEDCRALMAAIDQGLVPSTVTRGPEDFRTSRTCHLRAVDAAMSERIDQSLAALMGVDPAYAEPLQGQRYDSGQYFRAHTDWFAPGTEEFEEHTRVGGQRTWTVMVYLNGVEQGGETCFERLGRCFTPVAGMGLAWNNLLMDGAPNPATLHEAMPVLRGQKYVVTKWFRTDSGRL